MLQLIWDSLPRPGIVELDSMVHLAVRDGMEVLIPKSARKDVMSTLHLTHLATNSMMLQTKSRLFWPGIRADLESCYKQCQECALNRNSKPQKKNEIDMSNLFENFFPGSRVQIDFCQKGNEDYLVMVCQMSGFMQVYSYRNKSTEEAWIKLREWSSSFGFPMTLVAGSGLSFSNRFVEDCLKLAVRVEHSSAYNSSSQSIVQPDGCGSPIARFFMRDVTGGLPNSLDSSLDWRSLMENRRKAHLSRFNRCTKDSFEIGEKDRIQNIQFKLWFQ